MAETIYPKGLRTFPPREDAPDYVKSVCLVTINELVRFCKENPDYMSDYKGEPQLKLKILEGKKGLYFAVDTYKSESKAPPVIEDDDSPF